MVNLTIIETRLRDWDGKSTNELSQLVHQCSSNPEVMAGLIAFMQQQDLQKTASWVIKNSLEAGSVLTESQVSDVFQQLSNELQWETQLHILQSMPYLPIAKQDVKALDSFLRHSLKHENKFVRAWSYSGFYELARQHPGEIVDGQPQRKKECLQFFDLAMKDDAASVKARIRQLLKKGF